MKPESKLKSSRMLRLRKRKLKLKAQNRDNLLQPLVRKVQHKNQMIRKILLLGRLPTDQQPEALQVAANETEEDLIINFDAKRRKNRQSGRKFVSLFACVNGKFKILIISKALLLSSALSLSSLIQILKSFNQSAC